jgi:hypothetical protein
MPYPLQVQQPDLGQMFGQNSLYSTMYGMQREDAAKAAASQNLSQAQQSQQFEADQHPLDLAKITADTRHTNALAGNTEAMIPGTQASSNMKVREDQVDAQVPMDTKVKQALSHIAATISDDQYKDAENHVLLGMQSDDPAIRQQAMAAFPNLRAIAQERLKLKQEGENSAKVAGIQAGAEIKKEQMAIDAGKYFKNSSEGMRLSSSLKGLTFEQQSNVYQNMAMRAKAEGDLAQAQFYAEQADRAAKLAVQQKAASAQTANAGKADLNTFDIPTVTPPAAVQPGLPANPLNTQEPAASAARVPGQYTPGQIVDHPAGRFRFKGGDPSKEENWEKV